MTGSELGAEPAFPVIGVPGYGACVPVALPGGQQEWSECQGGLTKREYFAAMFAARMVSPELATVDGAEAGDVAGQALVLSEDLCDELAKARK